MVEGAFGELAGLRRCGPSNHFPGTIARVEINQYESFTSEIHGDVEVVKTGSGIHRRAGASKKGIPQVGWEEHGVS